MLLRYRVDGQTIIAQTNKSEPRRGSKEYLELQFLFSPDWENLNKYVYFQHGGVSEPKDLESDIIKVPEYFTEQESFKVTLFGQSTDGRIEVPTNVIEISLAESNDLWHKDAPEPQKSWVTEVLDARTAAEVAADRAELAAERTPRPNESTGTWWIWDSSLEDYVDTKLPYVYVPTTALPESTAADAGKVLMVDDDGNAAWTEVSNAETGTSITTVNSVDEMTDTSKEYILASTGTIWRYQETTVAGEVTEQVDGEFAENSRLGSDGSVQTGTGYAAYVTTPFIDLLAYPVPFILHLNGGTFIPDASDSYTKICTYTGTQEKINCLNTLQISIKSCINVGDADVSVDSDGNASILFSKIPKTNNNNSDGVLKYVRFSGKGTIEAARAYVTYDGEITGFAWVDTGIPGSAGSSGSVNSEVLAKISAMNNEGEDPATTKLLPAPVLDFYNSDNYPDGDYSVTHLSKITYPFRADIPVPYTVKWTHNEDAMRTTVAVDTKAIGAVNAATMRTYDATGFDNYPIYNLLPNTMYYYRVTHVLSDGSIVEAKSGSFTTSAETWRLLYIEGTQNVRDLGGWMGLGGKKVKYGKIIRGAAFSDSSYPGLLLTGRGRLALGDLKIQAELNLGAIDSETSIAANCAYKKIYYTNYATAITDDTARANFKTIFEWIVSCLNGTLEQSGLPTVARNIYMHCQGGCDRTGTLSFLLLGLLGVSESDLAKEYELSSFSDVGFGRLRTTTKAVDTYDYVGMVESLKTYSGDTITEKFVDFAINGCGVSSDTIDAFRSLMLE